MATWVSDTPDSAPVLVTATGAVLVMAKLSPSWPLVPSPQQYAAPVLACARETAQSDIAPNINLGQGQPQRTPMVVTATGVLARLVPPSPTSPKWLLPQHQATPALVSAHAESVPTLIWVKTWLPDTSTGAVLAVLPPFPSATKSPLPLLLLPQQ